VRRAHACGVRASHQFASAEACGLRSGLDGV
jgi:hypothetical protein